MKKKANKEQDVLEYMRSITNIPRYEPMKTTLIEWCEYWLSTRANNLKDSSYYVKEIVIRRKSVMNKKDNNIVESKFCSNCGCELTSSNKYRDRCLSPET